MKNAIARRIAHLESKAALAAETARRSARVVFRLGLLKHLPREYTGERHVAIIERCPCPDPQDHQYCRFEERPGPAPADAAEPAYDSNTGLRWIDMCLVRSPSDTSPEEQSWAELTARCRQRGT